MFWCFVAGLSVAVITQNLFSSDTRLNAVITIETLDSNEVCGTATWKIFTPVAVEVRLSKPDGSPIGQWPESWPGKVKTEWGIDSTQVLGYDRRTGLEREIVTGVNLGVSYPRVKFGQPYRWCFSGFGSLIKHPYWIEVSTTTRGAAIFGTTKFVADGTNLSLSDKK